MCWFWGKRCSEGVWAQFHVRVESPGGQLGIVASTPVTDLELFIPKSTRKSHNRTPSAPWFSKELKQLIRRKNRLFKKAHASGNSDHWKTYCLERKQNNGSNKTSKKRSLPQSGQHSIRPELFPVKMVAGRKRSLWIQKRCILLCSAAAGQLWKCHLRAG